MNGAMKHYYSRCTAVEASQQALGAHLLSAVQGAGVLHWSMMSCTVNSHLQGAASVSSSKH